MKKKLLFGFIVVLLLLDWAALDDVTTGNEPNLTGEYLMIVVSIPLLSAIGYFLLRERSFVHFSNFLSKFSKIRAWKL